VFTQTTWFIAMAAVVLGAVIGAGAWSHLRCFGPPGGVLRTDGRTGR
jgi:hypothetical protein